jgi:hypothetical protein
MEIQRTGNVFRSSDNKASCHSHWKILTLMTGKLVTLFDSAVPSSYLEKLEKGRTGPNG